MDGIRQNKIGQGFDKPWRAGLRTKPATIWRTQADKSKYHPLPPHEQCHETMFVAAEVAKPKFQDGWKIRSHLTSAATGLKETLDFTIPRPRGPEILAAFF